MPGSAVSGSGSLSSSSSRRARMRQYRVISNHSQVDETLFGTPNHIQQRNEMLNDKWDSSPEITLERMADQRNTNRRKSRNKKKPKETVQVITKDLIRNLIVPTEDPSGQTVIVNKFEFGRIQRAANTLTKDQQEGIVEQIKRQKEYAQDALTERRNFMKTMDMNRRKNEKLNELEEEAKEKAQHLLEKANEMRQEQEDEIKHLNEWMLNAKCHAIRDAQIIEKDQIRNEMAHEERRLDNMMEVDRQNAIQIQESIERKRKDERLRGAVKILDQIQENEQEFLLELERKDQENIHMQKYTEKLMEEDKDKLEKKHYEQEALREQLNQANEAMLDRKQMREEQEKLEELKVVEYTKQKSEREAAFEAEQEKIRIQKEKEVARLRALQERARDEQAERDALRAKRAQEQAERDWRQKEAEEARKKAQTEGMLKAARSQQMAQKEHFLAVQAQRERSEFERVLGAQKENIEKEKREDDTKVERRLQHAEDVRQQIRKKERDRVMDRNAFFEEGVQLEEEARQRRTKLEDVKRKKVQELRNAGIPEKYLSQVERKINQPQHIVA